MGRGDDSTKLTIRVPRDVRAWLGNQTKRNASTLASEIVRAVRERMERTEAALKGQ